MPDLGPVVAALWDALGPAIGAALKALLRTVFGMVVLGVIVTALTVYFAAQGSWLRALLAVLLSVAALAVVTGVLAVKNAVTRGLLHGLEKLNLASRVLTALFNRLGVTERSTHGERAGALSMVERLPLRDAESRLTGAAQGLLAERAQQTGVRAWLARKLLGAAVERVENLTLARFRSEDAKAGGVDLLLVRDELAATIDNTLARTVTGQLNKVNYLAATLYVLFAVAIALLLPLVVHN